MRGAQGFNLLGPRPSLGDLHCNTYEQAPPAKKPKPTPTPPRPRKPKTSNAPTPPRHQKQKTSKFEWVKPIVGVKRDKDLLLYRV